MPDYCVKDAIFRMMDNALCIGLAMANCFVETGIWMYLAVSVEQDKQL